MGCNSIDKYLGLGGMVDPMVGKLDSSSLDCEPAVEACSYFGLDEDSYSERRCRLKKNIFI